MNPSEEILNLVISKPDWIETLEYIVKKKKIDPNNINIKEIVSHYIDYINALNEFDLRIPANLILAASILLRIKAYSIKFYEEKRKELDLEYIELKEPLLKIRKKKVTLNDLIETVKDIIKIEEKKKLKKVKRKELEFSYVADEESFIFNVPYIEEIVEEKEDFEEFVDFVYKKIDLLKDNEGTVLFSQLVFNVEDSLEICKYFLAVLHLANKGKIVLWQENYFKDIIIKLVSEDEVRREA